MRKFRVEVVMVLDVEISDEVLALHKDDSFVDDFYGLDMPEKIAGYLAWNIGIQDRRLSQLDGFAGCSDDEAKATMDFIQFSQDRP